MLILRHKRKTKAASALENGAEGGADKEVYNGQPQMYQPNGNELATNANVWEMEGGGRPAPWELEAAQIKYGEHEGRDEKAVVDPALR